MRSLKKWYLRLPYDDFSGCFCDYQRMKNTFSCIALLFSLQLFTLLSIVRADSSSIVPVQWSQEEIERIKPLSFKHIPRYIEDPSNQYLHVPAAIKLGEDLFNDKRMSTNLAVACATCHIKQKAFTDKRNIALGIRIGVRNTPSLLNVAQQNWFFWDGRKDSLWSQALGPLENPAEHAFSRLQMIHFIANDTDYHKRYEHIFKQPLADADTLSALPEKGGPNGNIDELIAWKKLPTERKKMVNRVFSNIGKAIAAFVSTLTSGPARFDHFVAELETKGKSSLLSASAQRGLKLFTGRAGCANCHQGALFSNKEFHNIGTGIPGKDNGRAEVISEVKHDVFNCLGEFSDASADQCLNLTYMSTNSHAMAGAYRTPSLRNVSKTAPYMHDGRFKTLNAVLDYYAGIDKQKALQTDLPEMKLSEQDKTDLVHFLQTL